jgi:cell division protein FtsL
MSTIEKMRTSARSGVGTMTPRARYLDGEIDLEEPVFSRPRYSAAIADEVKRDIEIGNPDILPSGATMKMLDRASARERLFSDEPRVTYKVNAKGKLFLALYAVAVLSLILVIVLNALAIERQKRENYEISEQVAYWSSSVENFKGQNESMSNPDYIKERAQQLGMTQVEAEVIKVNPPAKAVRAEKKSVNWFDWLCDLFS